MGQLPVHWYEGVLLRPQHLQSAERNLRESMRTAIEWQVGYCYGLRGLEIDHDALANWEFRVRRLQARLKDGTHIRCPEELSIAPVRLERDQFEAGTASPQLMIHLALPRLELGRKNAAAGDVEGQADAVTARFEIEEQDVEDENSPGYPVPLQFRRLNARLLAGSSDIDAYETIPLARLKLSTTAEIQPVIDTDFIPPLLSCDAWTYLHDHLLKGIFDTISGEATRVSRIVQDQAVSYESGDFQAIEILNHLQCLNTGVAVLQNLHTARGIHPLDAFRDLCQFVGMLSVFRPDWQRRYPEVPLYDHDDLAYCFHAIRDLLRSKAAAQESYEKRVFVGDGLQMRVRLEKEWLGNDWQFFLGVHSNLDFQSLKQLLLVKLALKVGSCDEVDQLYTARIPGVTLEPQPNPSRVLPRGEWTYWQLERRSKKWQRVEQTLNLGIRFNEEQVEYGQDSRISDLTSRETVRIKLPNGKLTELQFALFATKSITTKSR